MNGRWQAGQSGNPKGRPAGTGEVAKLRAGIAEQVPAILAKLSEAALGGDVQAARLLIERVIPPVKAVELNIELPPMGDGTLSEHARRVLAAVAEGAIAPDQGTALIGALAGVAKITEIDELVRRIERLEAANQERK
jgi:hypothetical protein